MSKTYRYILSLDPSGAYNEGKGTTGWTLFDGVHCQIVEMGVISALDYSRFEKYYEAHLNLLDDAKEAFGANVIVVMEDFLLYENKAKEHSLSRMETSKLIGVIQYHMFSKGMPYYMQLASEIKSRWTDDILVHRKHLVKVGSRYFANINNTTVKINKHIKDSLRHAVHFNTFRNEDKSND